MKKYSKLRGQDRVDLSVAIPLPAPFTIFIEPTNVCNFSCSFCPESFNDFYEISGGRNFLSFDKFKVIADQIEAIGGVSTINFYMMGEPFANKELLSFISYARESSLANRLIVTTNGSLIREPLFKEICSSGLDYLRVSIYGPNETQHKNVTKNKIPLSKIRSNIANLRSFRDENNYSHPFIYLKMIERSHAENEEFLEYFKSVGDEVMLEPVMNWNDPEEGVLSGIDSNTLLKSDYFKYKKKICPFPFYTLVIHSDLKVSVCCVDWNKKLVVGDLEKQSLMDIWHGDKLKNIWIKHLTNKRHELDGCRDCTFIHTAPDNIDSISADVVKKL